MKVKTKSMIVLMIVLFAVILLGATTKVNAYAYAEAIVETGEISKEFNINDTFNLNIKMSEIEKAPKLIIEQLSSQLSEQGVKIKEVNANESEEKSHITVYLDSEKTMNIIIYGDNYNIITEKVVNIIYNNSNNYNTTDKESVKNAVENLNLIKENNRYIVKDYIELGSSLDMEIYNIAGLNKAFHDSSISIARGAGGGGGGFPKPFQAGYKDVVAEYYIYKNDVYYMSINCSADLTYKITVPSNENTEEYAISKIEEHLKNYNKDANDMMGTVGKDVTFSKLENVSGENYKVYYKLVNGVEESADILIKGGNAKPTTEPVTKEDTETGVKLETTTGTLTKDVVLTSTIIREVTNPVTKDTIRNISQKTTVYDINLLKDNVKIQPNGKVKISLPIPEGYDKTKLEIYRVDENGEKTKYDVKVEGNYATFETDHFSIYVLADVTKNDTPNNNQGTTNNTQPPKTDNRELDETPKTGTIDIVKYILPVIIISAVGIIALRKKTK